LRLRKGPPDFLIILSTSLLLAIGIVMVFSSSAYSAMISYGDQFYFLKRQGIWTILGAMGLFSAMQLDYFLVRRYAKIFLIGAILLLLLVLVIGLESHGSRRSLGMGFLTFQPSEVIKLAMAIYLARSLSEAGDRLKDFRRGLLPRLIILGAVCGLILAQPDLGTTIAVAGTAYILLAAAGARVSHLIGLAIIGLVGVFVAIFTADYRMQRLLSFLNPYADPTDSGFQIIQSLLALGSGGLFGMGLGQGRQKLLYIPERHTDFIFAIIGEELGFIGASLVICLFLILLWRGLRVAVTAPDTYGSLLAVGLTCMIVFQAIINIGVVTGSMPITGITLPLISYGGSSLLFTLISIGLLLNISRYAGQR